ncbi:MAG: hemolysin III family protein [Phycisphaerales bacterium]|nr:hemolysin III family protein [Phycisphaerales bacterium]
MHLTDPVSTITHATGAIVFALLSIDLLRRGRGHPGRLAALAIFAGSSVLLLAASTAFHAAPAGSTTRSVLQRVDHAAIFILIAGTFTAIHAIRFRGLMRWGLIALIWTLAAAGIAIKTVFFTLVPEWLGVSLYLAMGWMGLAAMIGTWRTWGPRAALLMLAAGLAYTAGALVEMTNWPTLTPAWGPHEVFHLFVLLGLSLFWLDIRAIATLARTGALQSTQRPRRERARPLLPLQHSTTPAPQTHQAR